MENNFNNNNEKLPEISRIKITWLEEEPEIEGFDNVDNSDISDEKIQVEV